MSSRIIAGVMKWGKWGANLSTSEMERLIQECVDEGVYTFNVTLELVRRGYTEEEISLLWSGNLLRVLDECQAIAKQIQSEETN